MALYEYPGTTHMPMCARETTRANWRRRPSIPACLRGCGWVEDHDWLYSYWDRDGVLLYVGITANAEQRAASHRAASLWWPFIHEVDAELVPRAHIGWIEQGVIREEDPIFNTTYSLVPDERRVEYLAQHEAWDLVDEYLRRRMCVV